MRGGRGTASARGRLVAESVEDLSQASVLVGLQAAGAGHVHVPTAHPFTGVGFITAHFFFSCVFTLIAARKYPKVHC